LIGRGESACRQARVRPKAAATFIRQTFRKGTQEKERERYYR
jgi:hypothetical protein